MNSFKELLQIDASAAKQALAADVEVAYRRIRDHIRKTPLEYSFWLSQISKSFVYIKLEHEQETNSFKLRGATNKIRKLLEQPGPSKRIITASTGNHALACARATKGLDVDCLICVKETANESKLRGLQNRGANVKKHGLDCLETEMYARNLAKETNCIYVSPYNDLDVIAGQGTIGIEVWDQLQDVDVMFLSVGGGGLISGVAAYLKQKNPKIKIVGCQPENSAVMYHSIKAGKTLDMESLDTLSDGTSGGVEQDAITFDTCKELVDEWVLVSEDEISFAVYKMLDEHCKVVEGASGVALASFIKTMSQYEGKNVVILSCGANISIDKLQGVLTKHQK
eukprot:gene11869-13102_t